MDVFSRSTRLKPEWDYYKYVDPRDACELCGQKRTLGEKICFTCIGHCQGIVLHTCRNFLYMWGHAVDVDTRMADHGSNPAEKAVSCVLNHFPSYLGALVQKSAKSMLSDGAWFAHAMTYRFYAASFPLKTNPLTTIQLPEFVQMRRFFFEALTQVNPHPNYPCQNCPGSRYTERESEPEKLLRDGFRTPETDINMWHYIAKLIKDLEKKGKLKIDLNRSDADTLQTRLQISQAGGMKQTAKNPPKNTASDGNNMAQTQKSN